MTTFQKDAALRVARHLRRVRAQPGERALRRLEDPGTQPKAYRNYKELLADKDVQAVLIATPGALALPDGAGRAGRGQGRLRREAALPDARARRRRWWRRRRRRRASSRWGCSAAATTCTRKAARSWPPANWAAVRMVRSWWLNNYLGGAPATKLDGPLDWEQWQGPAARRAFDRQPLPQLALLLRLRRRHSRRPGRARLRRHPHADERGLSAGGERPPRASRTRQGVDQPESVVAIGGVSRGLHRRLHHQLCGHAVPARATISSISSMATRRAWISAAKS